MRDLIVREIITRAIRLERWSSLTTDQIADEVLTGLAFSGYAIVRTTQDEQTKDVRIEVIKNGTARV